MLEITVTPEMRQRAREMAEPLVRLYRNNPKSIRRGQGHYYAKLGELAVTETLGWKHIDTFHADAEAVLVNGQNRKVELKVKDRTVPPRGHFNATVAEANTKQACDYYLFCSTLRDDAVYVLTIIPKNEFLTKAVYRKKGELDPDGPPGQGWRFRANCYNMRYDDAAMHPVGRTPLSD